MLNGKCDHPWLISQGEVMVIQNEFQSQLCKTIDYTNDETHWKGEAAVKCLNQSKHIWSGCEKLLRVYTGKKTFATLASYKDSCKSRPEAFYWVFLRLFKLFWLNNLSDRNFDCFLSFSANWVVLQRQIHRGWAFEDCFTKFLSSEGYPWFEDGKR